MQRKLRWVMGLAICLAGRAVDAQSAAPAWLAGCWRAQQGANLIDEWWMPPVGEMMQGMSRTTRGGAVRAFEQLRMVQVEGTLRYIAVPDRQRETMFTLTTRTDSAVTFENAQHDFPQRIAYERRGADSVMATVGNPGGRAFTLRYGRVRCE